MCSMILNEWNATNSLPHFQTSVFYAWFLNGVHWINYYWTQLPSSIRTVQDQWMIGDSGWPTFGAGREATAVETQLTTSLPPLWGQHVVYTVRESKPIRGTSMLRSLPQTPAIVLSFSVLPQYSWAFSSIKIKLHWIWWSHNGSHEDFNILGYSVVQSRLLGDWFMQVSWLTQSLTLKRRYVPSKHCWSLPGYMVKVKVKLSLCLTN
jgi:hypothetical protein